MPIVIQAPQPFAPAISQEFGRAQIEQQNTPTLASLYAAAGRERQAAYIDEANRFAQNARVQAGLQEQARQHAEDLQFKQDVFRSSLGPTQRDVFAAQVEDAKANQHAQNTAWVHQQDMTFADEMRLKNQQQAVSEVERAWNNGINPEITQQERNDYLTELRTGIDPAKKRAERGLAEQEQARAEQYNNQVRMVKQSEIAADQLEADAKAQGIGTMRRFDPRTGTVNVLFKNPKTGMWYNPDVTHAGEGMSKGGVGAGGIGAEQYLKLRAQAEKDVEALIERNDNLRAKTDANGKSLGLGDPNITWANKTPLLADRLRGMGLSENLQGHLGQGQTQPTQAGPPERTSELTKPFEQESEASPVQQQQLASWRSQADQVQKLPIPQPAKEQYAAAVGLLSRLLQDYGTVADPSKMSPEDRAAWQLAVSAKGTIERMGFNNPAAGPSYLGQAQAFMGMRHAGRVP